MVTLNLTAMTTEEIILKDYLENNASDVLAQKINDGVHIEKDGKTLINKKTLEHFMTDYAYKEAQKQAKQGARSVGVYKDAIFNWLVHYFEEDTIEGKLYNMDGTEYKPAPAKVVSSPIVKKISKLADKPKPMDLFDMMAAQQQEAKLAEFENGQSEVAELDEVEEDEAPELSENEQDEILDELAQEPETVSKTTETFIGPVPDEVDKSKLIKVNESLCVDTTNGVVYKQPAANIMPEFLVTLFGSALKVEV